ncbi:hypothetical protein [Noviherbaspirillum sp. Root189]|uniref:hypothetical protein n=1 Tax=Noviherbaspirillum sp. Root189 TaxID=1736487 RepID=UPI00070DA4BC|nr:hypothetical protein [Noviherbaspirillum sp. Root189]KRB84608.1 hypothetical protein ASE07_04215 [Noviherbaspirillum sp. Root189]
MLPTLDMDLFNDIVWRSFLLLLWGGSVIAVLLGIGLLIAPAQTEKINRYWSRWVDVSRMTRTIGKPQQLERWVYRHHRIVGGLILFGSLYVLNAFLLRTGRLKIERLASMDPFGLVDAVWVFFVIAGVLSAFFGAVIAFKPSILRDLEVALNKSISSKNLFERCNGLYFCIDAYIFQRRKFSAFVLIGCGLYVSVRLGIVLLKGDWKL